MRKRMGRVLAVLFAGALLVGCAGQSSQGGQDSGGSATRVEGSTTAAQKDGNTVDIRDDDEDELLYDAGSLIISSGQASVSYLQRRLAIGNPRAARLMDMLEAKGVVGGPNGSKPRDVLMSLDEFEEIYG